MTRGICALAIVVVGALWVAADARPGGGQSYSGGSHSYSGGSHSSSSGGRYSSSSSGHSYSGGGYSSSHTSSGSGSTSLSAGATIGLIIGGLILFGIIALAANSQSELTSTYTSAYSPPSPPPQLELAPLLAADPDFSRVAFEDFVYRLYSAAQRARHDRTALAKLTPYLGPGALDRLAQRSGAVQQVVIGNLRIIDASGASNENRSRLVVAIEANLAGPGGTTNASERWTFVRDVGAKTRPPDQTRTLACPNCNAPFTAGDDPRQCAHCSAMIHVGHFDWTVHTIAVDAETSVGYTLTGTSEEVGNDYPTLSEPNALTALTALRQDDANVTWDALIARAKMIYERLNVAWNARDLTPVRGLVTSSLLQYLQFWIDEYNRQGLANKLTEPRFAHVKLAKVMRDKWYDAITVRIYADGFDFTENAEGALVGGSRDSRRAYTEYWTFLRSSARRGPITTTPSCPNCGAPLSISTAGSCTHCNAEVENGSVDWTLSKIEQDDVYRG